MSFKNVRIGILSIGNEILSGIIVGTNSHWMINQIVKFGGEIIETMTVKDEKEHIGKAIKRLLEDDLDFILTTGGLGPTHDDISVLSIAGSLNLDLEENKQAIEIISRQYDKLFKKKIVKSPELTPERVKMGLLPKGSTPLNNEIGGAPGVLIEPAGRKSKIILLPGVPEEMKHIFTDSVIPLILEKMSQQNSEKYYQEFTEVSITDESYFSPFIDEVSKKYPSVYIKSMPKPYGTINKLRIWVSSRNTNEKTAQENVKNAINLLKKYEKKINK
ncbi:MAG: competence/damage-inducible protein A [Candidatus Ranarchaeia archaeon]